MGFVIVVASPLAEARLCSLRSVSISRLPLLLSLMIGVNKSIKCAACFAGDRDGSPPLSSKVTNNAAA